ncbi:SigE family RNA polymerase sigma factor [Nocardioides ferulae]|uniref:SigE family RNA polymerase sigma factor n=1 Tax=Nocardioides ferulae TaxID=2340821 RepID=UPI001F0C5604|nr:SigE family RNA polymerase sigma factor [Nocardioides ferulae]
MAEQSRAADAPTFEEWATARAPALLRFGYLLTGSQHAAEDAVQTALTRACEKWGRVSRTADPDTYVRRMVVNAHVSAWRKAGRRELSVADVRDVPPSALHGDPADRVATDDAVWRMCGGLPARPRAAVVLRYYEDLEYAEIGAVLGCSEATARSYVHRALTALRAQLRAGEHGHD